MSKLWICGICQNNYDDIVEIFEPLKDLNLNSLWVDGGSTDGTIQVLEDYGAEIVHRKWTNDHDFQMNEYMRAGIIKHGDWIMQMDTSERIHIDFIDKLNGGMLDNFEKQRINTVYQRSKPLLFRYYDDMIFLGSPHWGIVGERDVRVRINEFDGFQEDITYFWSNRDNINKWITNGIKYYYVYGRSNHMRLIYHPANYPGSPPNIIDQHEANRMRFRDYCRDGLNFRLDGSIDEIMEPFDAYLKADNFTEEFIKFMNYEKVIANYYRYIQGEDQQNIYNTQNSWKFSI